MTTAPITGELTETKVERLPVSLLVILMDTNPSQRQLRQDPEHITQCLEAVIALGNAHLMQSSKNELAIMSSNHQATEFLFPTSRSRDMRQVDGQYEPFTAVEMIVKQRLGYIITNAPRLNKPTETLIAGAIGMALCYVSRQREAAPEDVKVNARLVVITGSHECQNQYMSYMNVFFCAHKLGVVLDVCALERNLTLLQQGCDITGGQYLQLNQMDGLLQYMLWVFLPAPSIRKQLVLPPSAKVDYRAACFCHRELVDVGFVCSVCMSIFCKYSPICTTCQAVFKTSGPLLAKMKRRKK